MGSAGEELADVVGYRTHVGAAGNTGTEGSAIGFAGEDFEFPDLDLYGLKNDFFLFSSEFVRRHAFDLLGGEWGRSLGDDPAELCGCGFQLVSLYGDRLRFAGGVALGVIGIGGESEADAALVRFFRADVELCEAREVAAIRH